MDVGYVGICVTEAIDEVGELRDWVVHFHAYTVNI